MQKNRIFTIMKKVLLLILCIYGTKVYAQTDTQPKLQSANKPIGLSMSVGHLSSNTSVDEKPVAGTLFTPQLEIGKRIKIEVGATFLSIDRHLYAGLPRRQTGFNAGLSFSEYIGDSPFYGKGSYRLLLGETSLGRVVSQAHRISGEVGISAVNMRFDMFVEVGKYFDNKQVFTGNTVSLG